MSDPIFKLIELRNQQYAEANADDLSDAECAKRSRIEMRTYIKLITTAPTTKEGLAAYTALILGAEEHAAGRPLGMKKRANQLNTDDILATVIRTIAAFQVGARK